MNKVGAGTTFVVLSAGMYFLAGNAHIDIFPCTVTQRDSTWPGPFEEAPLRTRDGTCSLLAHQRPGYAGESERLTGLGWVALVAFCGGIGLVGGVAAGFATRRKQA